jgi:hypothetical protein
MRLRRGIFKKILREAQPPMTTDNCSLTIGNFFTRSKRRGGGSKTSSLDQPPRLREIRRLRDVHLIAQPPLLARRGDRSHLDAPGCERLRRHVVFSFLLAGPTYNAHISGGIVMKRLLTFAAVSITLASPVLSQNRAAGAACDRECLRGMVTQYLEAMVAHNPKALPLAASVRFTEDTKTMPLGEGLWKGASKIGTYRMDFLDVREGQAASHVVVEENGMPVMLALRLKVANKQITEIETLVTRNRTEGAIWAIENLTKANDGMTVVPTPAQKMSREELVRIAEFYPLGLKVGGSFDAVKAPFAPGAYRFENGVKAAGPGSRGNANIGSQRIIAHPDVTYRIAAVDEELGIVLMRLDFGNTNSYGPGNALTTFEAFKVYGGQLHAVEAFIDIMPENTPSGWPNYEVKKPK